MKRSYIFTFIFVLSIFLSFAVVQIAFAEEKGHHPNHPGLKSGEEQGKWKREAMKKVLIHRFLEKEMPEFLEQVKATQEEYPEAVQEFKKDLKKGDKQRLFHGSAKGKMDPETKEILQQFLQNELESYVLAQKYTESTDEKEREHLEKEMRQVLKISFDLKAELQKKAIAKMEERIQKLKDLLEKRRELKEQIISDRLETITNDSKLTKW